MFLPFNNSTSRTLVWGKFEIEKKNMRDNVYYSLFIRKKYYQIHTFQNG